MKVYLLLLFCHFVGTTVGFSMSMRDVGITDDIHRVACSLNDIFKESFELMIGSLGKHGVYYLPEIKHGLDRRDALEGIKRVEFHASNGWMKYPVLKAVEGMSSGALRKYKVNLAPTMKEILLVCVECLEISAQTVNFCYEATFNGKNVSGTITSGPVFYIISLEMRITQILKNGQDNHVVPSCNFTFGEKSLSLSERSSFRSEVRGLRSLNFLADNIDVWLKDHFNSTVKDQLQKRLLTTLTKVFTKHSVCEEFIRE